MTQIQVIGDYPRIFQFRQSMIFERAARREFAQAAAGISVVLLAILTSTQLIRLLNDAAGGRIAPEAVLALLGFSLRSIFFPFFCR